MTLDQVCTAIAHSGLSLTIGAHHWITPALQTVHILAVACVLASVLVVDIRLLQSGGRDHFPLFARRYIPWIWRALVVLLATGILLTIGEPARELKNIVFAAKMTMVTLAVCLTAAAERPLRAALEGPEPIVLPAFTKPFAVISLILWAAIVVAGRWIAYV
jgi:hypothetical protein